MHDEIRAAVRRDFARTRTELETMIRVPSISAPGYDAAQVRRSAELVADLVRSSGADDVRILDRRDAHPAVYAHVPGPDGAPTVLLYAHHDVQPAGPADQWHTDPFEPVEIGGRLHARGSADDKCGIAMHLASIRAFVGRPPVGVKLLIEGEEEIGSPHLGDFLDEYADILQSDAIIIGDAGNWAPGVPGLTTSLRGLVDCVVTARTLRYAVHSGSFGGIYPDAITGLARTLAALHHDDGSVAVPGLVRGAVDDVEVTEQELIDQTQPIGGLEMIGTGSLASRMWRQPSISVIAIEAVPLAEAINQIVPEARAKVSLRIAPGEDPEAAMEALVEHLRASAPWGIELDVARGTAGAPFVADTSGPVHRAYRQGMRFGYGRDPVELGMGGSIPFIASFADHYPDAEVALVGVSDPTSRYHGPNESLEISDLESAIVAQAVTFDLLGS